MADLKKVVLFHARILQPGGGERLLFEEAKYFKKKGIKVKILTFEAKKMALFYKDVDLEIIREKSFISRVLALRKKLKEINPNVVIAQTHSDCMYLYLATKFTRIPYITHIHGTMFWFVDDPLKYAIIHRKVFDKIRASVAGHKEFIPKKPPFGIMKRIVVELMAILDYLAVKKARRIIVLTNQVKWEVKMLYGKDAIVSRGCLNPKILDYKPKRDVRKKLGLRNEKIILNIGRLDRRKRIDLLIKSFAKLCRKRRDIILLIGGIGEDEGRLRKLTKNLRVEDKVKFLGFVKDDEYLDYFAACDVFAFPSWTTSGIPPYEALAMGKNVVWTTEAEEPVLTDKHVFLAHPTVRDFTKAMEKALNTKVKEKVDLSNYTWDNYFSRIYAVCKEVAQVG